MNEPGSGSTGLTPNCVTAAPLKVSDTFFKFNTSLDISEDIMVYLTISEGFRRGGGNAVPVGGQVEILPSIGFKGNNLPGVPDLQFNLAADYVFITGIGEINLHLDGSYSSDVSSQLSEENSLYEELDGYAIVNLSLLWANDDVAVTAFAQNLTNEYAEVGMRNYVRPEADIGEFKYVNRPRTVGINVRYSF